MVSSCQHAIDMTNGDGDNSSGSDISMTQLLSAPNANQRGIRKMQYKILDSVEQQGFETRAEMNKKKTWP